MAKYSQEFKLKVLQYHFDTKSSARKTAIHFNIHESMVRQWAIQYKHHGEESLKPRTTNQIKSPQFKQRMVESVLKDGLSAREAMAKFKLRSHYEVLKWVRDYNVNGLKSKPQGRPKQMPKPQRSRIKTSQEDRNKTQEQLLEEIAYLRSENAFLKKRRALIQKQKQAEQQRLQDSYLN